MADVADKAGAVWVVLALPSWGDYLRTGLDDLIESASRSPVVLLRAGVLLISLLIAAPPSGQPPVARRLARTEELGGGNFTVTWHDTTGGEAR